VVIDDFPDPSDPAHVLALAARAGANDLAVFESRDAGVTFSGPLFAPPPGAVLTGVEIAAADAASVYVSFYENPGIHPRLARSVDSGAHWRTTDLEPALGPALPFLAAVDPIDPATVYLRVSGRTANQDAFEALAISRDAGATWSTPLVLRGGTLTSFFRRASGVLLATGTVAGARIAQRSDDGGATFAPWPIAIHPRGFAERDGRLYAATDDVNDGFALASSDDGDAWTPVMRFQDISAVRACLQPSCLGDCRARAALGLFVATICESANDGGPNDAGIVTLPAHRAVSSSSGCACGASDPQSPAGLGALGALAALLAQLAVGRARPVRSRLTFVDRDRERLRDHAEDLQRLAARGVSRQAGPARAVEQARVGLADETQHAGGGDVGVAQRLAQPPG
jgi:hypothetical protein